MAKNDQSNDFGAETIETISAAGTGQQQLKIEVDESQVGSTYSSTVRVWGSAEEINLDFAGPIRPSGPQTAKLKIDQRIVMNPWAAKRLAISLGQAIARYEQAYGPLELDAREASGQPPGRRSCPREAVVIGR